MAHGSPCVCCEDVGGVLDPRGAIVECIVDGRERRILRGCKGDILPSNAVDDNRDQLLHGGLHGQYFNFEREDFGGDFSERTIEVRGLRFVVAGCGLEAEKSRKCVGDQVPTRLRGHQSLGVGSKRLAYPATSARTSWTIEMALSQLLLPSTTSN